MATVIYVGRAERLLAIRVTGDGAWREAQALDAWAKGAIKEDTAGLVVDLSDSHQLDSTFVGTFVGLARLLQQRQLGEVAIYGVDENVRANLEELGVPLVISEIRADRLPHDVAWEVLPIGEPEPGALAKHVLAAHELLMEIEGANIPRFEESVSMLRASFSGASTESAGDQEKGKKSRG